MINKTIFLITISLIYCAYIIFNNLSILGLLISLICCYLFIQVLKSYKSEDNIFAFLIKTSLSFAIIMINITIINYRKYNTYLQQTTYNHNIINQTKSLTNIDKLQYFHGNNLEIKHKIHNDMLDFMIFKGYYDTLGDIILQPYNIAANSNLITKDFLKFRSYIKNKNYEICNTKYEDYSIFSYQMLKIKMFFHYVDKEYNIVQDMCSNHNIIEINDINHNLLGILSSNDKKLYTLFKNRFKNQNLFGLSY